MSQILTVPPSVARPLRVVKDGEEEGHMKVRMELPDGEMVKW